jgi:hypothetical protein
MRTLHMIIGSWKTPFHSENKHDDDFHGPSGVKQQILDEIGRHIFSHEVGKNPDIAIEKGSIVLVGSKMNPRHRGKKFRPNPSIKAEDFFVLKFMFENSMSLLTIQLIFVHSTEPRPRNRKSADITFYVIPKDLQLINLLIEVLYKNAARTGGNTFLIKLTTEVERCDK